MFCNHEFQKDFEDLVKDNMVNKKKLVQEIIW